MSAPLDRPILFVDVDGVISLFGFPGDADPPGRFHQVEGMVHCIGSSAGERLTRLADRFELVWATGWEERANEYLPRPMGLDLPELPTVRFTARPTVAAHWKLDAIDRYAGDRPAAWIDDALDERCEEWARGRAAPTLLVRTDPAIGLSDDHVRALLRWADEVGGAGPAPAPDTADAP